MNVTAKTRQRIGKAVLDENWCFRFFKKCERPKGRHSVYVSKPSNFNITWYAEKVPVIEGENDDGWVNRLLDEAGVT